MAKLMYLVLTHLLVGFPVVYSADECRAREKYIREPWTGEPLKNLAFISDKDGLTCILNFHGHDNYLFYDQIVLSNNENKVIKTNNGNIKHLKFDYTKKVIGWIKYTFSIENNSNFTVKIWDEVVLNYIVDFPVKTISTYGSNISLCSEPSWAVGENEAVVIPLYSKSRDEEMTGMPNPIKSSIYITLSSTVLFNPVIKMDGMKKFLTSKNGNVLLLSNFSQPLQPNKYVLELQTQESTVNINYKLDTTLHKLMEFQVEFVLSEIEISSQGRSFTVDLDISSGLNYFSPPSATTVSSSTTKIIPTSVITTAYTNTSETISTGAIMHGPSVDQPEGSNIGLIVGIIILVIALLALVIIIIFHMKHKQARSQKRNDLTNGTDRCITPEQDCLIENINDMSCQKTHILNERNYHAKKFMEESSSECLEDTRGAVLHVESLQNTSPTKLHFSASSGRCLDDDKGRIDDAKICQIQYDYKCKEKTYLDTIHNLQTKLNNNKNASTEYERKIREMDNRIDGQDEECTSLKEKVKNLNEELNGSTSLEEVNARIRDMQYKSKSKSEEHEEEKKEYKKKDVEYKKKDEDNKKKEKEFERKEEENKKKDEENKNKVKEFERKDEEYKRKDKDYENKEKEYKRKEEELKKKIDELHNRQNHDRMTNRGTEKRKAELEDEVKKLTEDKKNLEEELIKECLLRKMYFIQNEEMKGKIRVFCRVRPVNVKESSSTVNDIATEVKDKYSINLKYKGEIKSYVFDRVFHQKEDQITVFRDTHELLRSSLDGYNVTIMAYGQTGSGKTYTMIGDEANPGIARRAFLRLFELVKESSNRHNIQISTYMVELYNDKLIDLLKPKSKNQSVGLAIKKDEEGIVRIHGTELKDVHSAQDLSNVFDEGLKNRHTAKTRMNIESSRSHLLFTIFLTIVCRHTGNVLKSKLTLVDLAGSESVKKSGASGEQLSEAISINKSLSSLGDLISALSNESPKASFVNYRNSKLTMLLEDSLGGNAKTLVFVNASPSAFNVDETLNSLEYAKRIKKITNTVRTPKTRKN